MTCAHTLSFKRCPFQVAINHYFCADLRSAMGPSRCFSSPFREPRVSVIVSYYCGWVVWEWGSHHCIIGDPFKNSLKIPLLSHYHDYYIITVHYLVYFKYLSIYLSINQSIIYLSSIYLSINQLINQSSIYLSVCLSIYLSICLSICIIIYIYIFIAVNPMKPYKSLIGVPY